MSNFIQHQIKKCPQSLHSMGAKRGRRSPLKEDHNTKPLARLQKQVYTLLHLAQALLTGGTTRVLNHLLTDEYEPEVLQAPMEGFTPFKKVDANTLLEAQVNTTNWLAELGAKDDEDLVSDAQEAQARDAFHALTTDPTRAKDALTQITLPPAIQKLVGMLTVYEWSFVDYARQLRSMAVAKIVEETDHPDARIRLKALEILGRVTEVGLFTDRIEIKKSEMSDAELDEKIKEKLAALNKTIEVDATEVEDTSLVEDEQS